MDGYSAGGGPAQAKLPKRAAETVTTVVHRNHARFDGRPVRDFVPLFVERGARQELAKLGG